MDPRPGEERRGDEGKQVFGRPEGVHPEAGGTGGAQYSGYASAPLPKPNEPRAGAREVIPTRLAYPDAPLIWQIEDRQGGRQPPPEAW